MAGDIGIGSIEHEGVVREVTKGTIKIRLLNLDHCAGCHAKAGCSVSEKDSDIIEVPGSTGSFGPGDRVRVIFDAGMGPKALFYGYVLPFIVLLSVLLLTWALTNREGLSALMALGSLVPYYAFLSFFREQFKKSFSFRISRI